MNCVDYAINQIMNAGDIDPYLLELAFKNTNTNYQGNWYAVVNQTTVQQGIREKVIYKTVIPDCSLLGGKTEFIDLQGSRMRDLGNGYLEVNVPDVVTGGRKIISVTEVYLGSMTSSTGMLSMGVNGNTDCGQGTVNDMMQGLIDGLASNRNMPPTYTNVHMTGNNSFVIQGITGGTFSMTAKCIMEFDEGMSSIKPAHHPAFARLVTLAVKAYIYRTCKRPVNEAVKRSGVSLSDIKDDIMEYRDAWQQYEEYKEGSWRKCMAYSDTQWKSDSINMRTFRRM
jgi:hypothetical protein